MNLFFQRLTGKFLTTEKFEKHIQQLLDDDKRYREVENSDLLKEYLTLEETINSTRFQETKREYTTKKYKETVEYKNYTDFVALQKDKTVRKYMEAVNDEEREKYTGAISVKNYIQLKGIVEEEGFETRRLFWADKNRWKQTEEYRKEMRYLELKKNADIVFFLNAPKKKYEEVESWRETFSAPFNKTSIKENGFETGYWFSNKNLKKDFSMKSEAQAYAGEKNINIQSNVLSILCQKEQYESAIWNPKSGFTTKVFEYTSAKVNSGNSFMQPAEGLFIAKVRANGKCHSSIDLVNENGDKVIELFHYNGKKLVFGTAGKNGVNEETVSGINANDWYIVCALVSKNQITLLLNGKEIFTSGNPLSGEKVYFTMQSYAPAGKGAEGRMDVNWVRAFEKK